MKNAIIAGVGMTPFMTPKHSEPYHQMAVKAAEDALADAGISYDKVQQVFASYIYGDSCMGQRAVYDVGMTGVPIINVNNNCSSGSTALFLARQLVTSGALDCVMALGFEQMKPGAIGTAYPEKDDPMQKFMDHVRALMGDKVPPAPAGFAGAAVQYAEKYGLENETLAKISVKSRAHAAYNPRAIFRDPVTVEEVLNSMEICAPLTLLQCCPPSCGAAAAIVCSESFARKHGIDHGVSIIGQAMATDTAETFETDDLMHVMGYGMSASAAKQAYEQAGVGPEDVDVVELHDCFTSNELITYEAIGLTPEGTAEKFVNDGDNTYGGKYVVNPCGGMISKGHPSGATGIAQASELVWQLRGQADQRQVQGAQIALQHNLGLGGATVVTLYKKGF